MGKNTSTTKEVLSTLLQGLGKPALYLSRDECLEKSQTAISVPVEVIVSGDLDLLVLGEFQQIPILTTKQFLDNYQFTNTDAN